MLKLVMRALDPRQKPAIRFQMLDELLAVHGGYCNHSTEKGNAIPAKLRSSHPWLTGAYRIKRGAANATTRPMGYNADP